LVDTLFGVKQVLGKVHLYECAKFREGFPRFRQQIFVAKQLIIVEVLKPTMDACSLPVLPDYEQRAQLSYQPGKSRMLQHSDGRARRIVRFRHGHRSRVARNVHDSAIREPVKQFRYVPDINRKLYTSPLATAEPGDLLNQNPGNCSQASIRSLDLARNLLFKFWIVNCRYVFKSPEGTVQSGQFLPRKTQLDHFIYLFIHTQIAYSCP